MRSLCLTIIILQAHDLLWILASYSFLSCPRFFSHLVHFKYFNVDGCHTLEFIINCEQSLGRWKVHLMTSGMKGVMLGMLTNADDLSSPSSFPYRRILPQESQFGKALLAGDSLIYTKTECDNRVAIMIYQKHKRALPGLVPMQPYTHFGGTVTPNIARRLMPLSFRSTVIPNPS